MLHEEQLVEFVSLQRRLVAAYGKVRPTFRANKWLIGVPARTYLQLGTERWEAIKHGAGIRYTRMEPEPPLVVDMHEEPDNTERLDAWRVQQYLESQGRHVDFDDCEAELQSAAISGSLIACARGYRLR